MGCQNPKDIQVFITGGHSIHALHVQPSRLSGHALTAKLHSKQSHLSLSPSTHCFTCKSSSSQNPSLIASWLEIQNLDLRYFDTIYCQDCAALLFNIFQSISMWTTCKNIKAFQVKDSLLPCFVCVTERWRIFPTTLSQGCLKIQFLYWQKSQKVGLHL